MSGEIEAVRELDCEVARRVMGGTKIELGTIMGEVGFPDSRDWMGYFGDFYTVVPEYSTDIGAAWSVVEKMESEGLLACVGRLPAGWTCCFADWEHTTPQVIAPTAPLAICKAALSCRAALAAVGAPK